MAKNRNIDSRYFFLRVKGTVGWLLAEITSANIIESVVESQFAIKDLQTGDSQLQPVGLILVNGKPCYEHKGTMQASLLRTLRAFRDTCRGPRRIRPHMRVFEDEKTVGIIYSVISDINVPVLVTYDKGANKIDSLNLFENASGFSFKSEIYEYATIYPDKNIQVINSTKI